MNRRELLKAGAAIPFAGVADASCRDERGLINPDWKDVECHDLTLRTGMMPDSSMIGRALFGMGVYEALMEVKAQKQGFGFTFEGKRYLIRVTSLSVDVNREIGCVVCDVRGQVWERG